MKKLVPFSEYYQNKTKNNPRLQAEIEASAARIALASQLIKIRESMGFTQCELADRLGVTQQLISKIEKGGNNTTVDTLFKVLFMLDIAVKVHFAKLKRKGRVLQFV